MTSERNQKGEVNMKKRQIRLLSIFFMLTILMLSGTTVITNVYANDNEVIQNQFDTLKEQIANTNKDYNKYKIIKKLFESLLIGFFSFAFGSFLLKKRVSKVFESKDISKIPRKYRRQYTKMKISSTEEIIDAFKLDYEKDFIFKPVLMGITGAIVITIVTIINHL